MTETTREEDPRRALIAVVPGLVERLERGIDVLSLGCGRGERLGALVREFPRSRFVGLDGSMDEIRCAWRAFRRAGSSRVRFEVRESAALRSWSEFDLVLACSIHQRPDDVERVVKGIHRALRYGGVFLMPPSAGRDVEVLRGAGFGEIAEAQVEECPDVCCHVATK